MKFSMTQIWDAVDDDHWQSIRRSMKGIPTSYKLDVCRKYYETHIFEQTPEKPVVDIRIDNYLKALCRGGQLYAGSGLDKALELNWKLEIRKN